MLREPDSRRRLTPMEALMWRLGTDPRLSATFGSVTFLDRAPDRRRVESRIAAAVHRIPRLRQRVVDRRWGTPWLAWQDDEDFDLDHHLSWRPAPGAGGEQDVLDLAARLVAEPFPDGRPLWNFVFVTGLPGGRAALVQRMHHVITDGQGGLRLSEQFVDLQRDPAPDGASAGSSTGEEAPPWLPRTVGGLAGRAGDLARTTGDAARWLGGGLTDPARFLDAGAEVIDTVTSLRRQVAVLDPARSPLLAQRSSTRQLLAGSVRFAPVRSAATEAGVSINDLFVTATLRAAASYHRSLGSPVDELRVAVPVSTRTGTTAAGNAFSPTRVLLPSGDGLAAAAHLRAVAELMGRTKHERATTLVEPLAAVTELVPAPVLRSVVHRQAATIDYAASNVRAAPVPLYIGGARIEATTAIGPLAGTGANITMMSYDGRIDLGVHTDAAAVTDAPLLRDTVVAAFHELCETTVAGATN